MELYAKTSNSDSLNSDTDLVFSSSGFINIILELLVGSFSNEILPYESECCHESWVNNFWEKMDFSNTGVEVDLIMESFFPGDKVCMHRPPGVSVEYFYFYPDVIGDFGLGTPFTTFQNKLLKTLNVSPHRSILTVGPFPELLRYYVGILTLLLLLTFFFSFYESRGLFKGYGCRLITCMVGPFSHPTDPITKVGEIYSSG